MGRDGDPEDDIAPVVLCLLSDATRSMTGQTFMVDGDAVYRSSTVGLTGYRADEILDAERAEHAPTPTPN